MVHLILSIYVLPISNNIPFLAASSSPSKHDASAAAAAAAPAPVHHPHTAGGATSGAGANGGLSEAEALAKAMAESLKLAAAAQQQTKSPPPSSGPPSATASPSPPPLTAASPASPPSAAGAAPGGASAVQASRFTDFAHVEVELSPIHGVFDDVHNPEVSIEDALARIPYDLKSFLYQAKRWARKSGKAAIEAILGMKGDYAIAVWL